MVDHHSGPRRIEDPRPGITFAVDAVEPAADRLADHEADPILADRLGRPVVVSDPGAPRLLAERDTAGVFRWEGNALADAVHLAFSQHRPLVLSPDVLWLTVAQGIAQHVRLHAEHLRHRLVEFEGKQTIEIERGVPADQLTRGDWAEAIDEFAAEVMRHVDPQALPPLTCSFSTTSAACRAASQVVLLEGFRRYFDLVMVCICGFPQITVLGTPADWEDILGRTKALTNIELGWWSERLVPIFEQCVLASRGAPDVGFWQRMYKLEDAYGYQEINGWFGHLYPYVLDGSKQPTARNPMLTGAQASIRSNQIPNGMSKVPVRVVEPHGARRVELVAGITGIAQEPGTGALTPVVGWAVTDASPVQHLIEQIRHGSGHRSTARREDVQWWRLGSGVPAGLMELFEDFERVELHAEDPSRAIVLHTPVDPTGIDGWGLDFGRGPGESTLCSVGEYLDDGSKFRVGLRRGPRKANMIAESFEQFIERLLREGAYFAQPDYEPLRTLEPRQW